jgi:4'-phosphopantetheinyl transferase
VFLLGRGIVQYHNRQVTIGFSARDVLVRYRLTYQLTEEAIADARDVLAPDERARCDRFRFPGDRRDFAIAHALLRRTLSTYSEEPPSGWTFVRGEHGKPSIASRHGDAADLAFNIAHTHGLVACAVALGTDIGVDVENIRFDVDGRELARHYFSAMETEWLDACDDGEHAIRFAELWTLKEAFIKAIAIGLSHPLNTFGFRFEGTSALHFSPPPDMDAAAWQFALFAPSPDHRMAVAIRRGIGRRQAIARDDAAGAELNALRTSVQNEPPD